MGPRGSTGHDLFRCSFECLKPLVKAPYWPLRTHHEAWGPQGRTRTALKDCNCEPSTFNRDTTPNISRFPSQSQAGFYFPSNFQHTPEVTRMLQTRLHIQMTIRKKKAVLLSVSQLSRMKVHAETDESFSAYILQAC